MGDNVNHQAHYCTGEYQCIDVMTEVFGVEAVKHFCLCNAFKYVWRMERKNGEEDAEKAAWYLNRYLILNKQNGSESEESSTSSYEQYEGKKESTQEQFVIHCKDCTKWIPMNPDKYPNTLGKCTFHEASFVSPLGFCCWGIKKVI